jgi:hypothetical protein
MGAALRPNCRMMDACTSLVPSEAKVPTAPENFATISTRSRNSSAFENS